jgi:phytanoyl-CoA hydroxylase
MIQTPQTAQTQTQPIQFTSDQMRQFQAQGFLILEQLLTPAQVEQISARLNPLFATHFETGIYPDEWHGRPGLSRPNATRQMAGMWRCDRTIASYSLSGQIARLNAELMGWTGGRLANDCCWIKPPDAPEVYFHRNSTYVTSINPGSVITCWIALGNASAASDTVSAVEILEAGTLEYVPGSHLWNCHDQVRFLHAPKEDYRQPLYQAAAEAGVEPVIHTAEIPAGGCIFLHGDLWHGSGRNQTDQTRRSFAVSTFPAEAQFQPAGTGYGYIFRRYQRIGETAMDESFFPILWTEQGYRSAFATAYCEDALPNSP